MFKWRPASERFTPFLFLIYINDITDLFSGAVYIKLFADNIKIYLEINDVSALPSLQKSRPIDDIASWSSTWQLKLAINKFSIFISAHLESRKFI